MSEQETMTPDAMRARADQLLATVRDDNHAIRQRAREAAQLRHEAGLTEERDMCAAELAGAEKRLERLRDSVAPLVTAKRQAEDRLGEEEARLAGHLAAIAAAEDADIPTGDLEDMDIRVARCRKQVLRRKQEVASAERAVGDAEGERDQQQAEVNELHAEHADLARRAANPGTAPDAPGLALGVDGIGDLDDDSRQLFALLALTLTAASGAAPAAPSGSLQVAGGANWRGDLGAMDASRPRVVRDGRGTHIIPPARPA
jgi:hypothetical protein